MGQNDPWFDDDDSFEDESPDDVDDESSDTVPCAHCGAEVYEDAVRCPVCGDYIEHSEGSPWTGRPIWWIVLGILGVLALIAALAGVVPW